MPQVRLLLCCHRRRHTGSVLSKHNPVRIPPGLGLHRRGCLWFCTVAGRPARLPWSQPEHARFVCDVMAGVVNESHALLHVHR